MKVEPEKEAAGINGGRAEASAADQYGHTGEGKESSGLADGFDLARLDGTYAVLRLSAETEQRPEVKFRSGCWWMLAVNQVLLLLGNTSQQAHQ